MNIRAFANILLITGLLFSASRIAYRVYANYKYNNQVFYAWRLADKASTISQKSEYINKFVDVLESSDLWGLNASLIFPTESTEFNENLKALKSLQGRLMSIKGMDENGFAYQTAIQQITAQEQGEANEMLECLESCWLQENFYTLWNPYIIWAFAIIQLALIVVGTTLLQD